MPDPCIGDDDLLALVDGTLAPEARALAERHIARCGPCRRLVAETIRRYDGVESAGAIGRYTRLEAIGAGAMGVVYAAYDPELDRKVALKVLRVPPSAPDTEALRARIVREGQALARLSHPNVVHVYEVGTIGDRVFLAMELIDGRTLAGWLEEKPRTWREVLDVFCEAGRGLATAHAANLVHRDFKPENVLVGRDGRVCVTDFGLAKLLGVPEAPGSGPIQAGTPRYMSPEQLAGEAADARSDIFSFCVATYEALFGAPPFKGGSVGELHASVERGLVAAPPRGSPVPSWVRRALLRGLRPAPADRYDSLDPLLHALAREPRARRRRGLFFAAAISVAALAIALVSRTRLPSCPEGAALKLAGAWDEPSKERIRAHVLGTAAPYAADAWRGFERSIDAYARRWSEAHAQTCEALRQGEQSSELFDLRMACLGDRLEELRTLALLVGSGDREVVAKAPSSAAELTALESCDGDEVLRRVKEPRDPRLRASVRALRGALSRAKAHERAGKYAEGLAVATEVARAAEALGYPPIRAEALHAVGRFEVFRGSYAAAEAKLGDALYAAEVARHDDLRARVLVDLVLLVGFLRSRPAEAERWARQAAAVIEGLGNPPLLRGRLDAYAGYVAYEDGRYAEALRYHERAFERYRARFGPEHLEVAMLLQARGDTLAALGRYADALRLLEQALSTRESALGTRHPRIAATLGSVANVLLALGRRTEAIASYRRALTIAEGALGPAHPAVALAYNNLAAALIDVGASDEAARHARTALRLYRQLHGGEHPDIAMALTNAGEALGRRGSRAEAANLLDDAVRMREKLLGADHPLVARSLLARGGLHRRQGNLHAAEVDLQRALRIREKKLGAAHPELAEVWLELGELWHQGRQPERSLRAFQGALGAARGRATLEASSHFGIARVLWDTRARRPEALSHARAAQAAYARAGDSGARDRGVVAAWLSTHAP
jgi:tetratricopeptide (TPR) repeat protein